MMYTQENLRQIHKDSKIMYLDEECWLEMEIHGNDEGFSTRGTNTAKILFQHMAMQPVFIPRTSNTEALSQLSVCDAAAQGTL